MLKLPEERRRWGESRKRGGGGEREDFLPSPSPLSFFRPRSYRKGYYFYSPQSSTVIKPKMAATTILRFRAPKILLHCRLNAPQPPLVPDKESVGYERWSAKERPGEDLACEQPFFPHLPVHRLVNWPGYPIAYRVLPSIRVWPERLRKCLGSRPHISWPQNSNNTIHADSCSFIETVIFSLFLR